MRDRLPPNQRLTSGWPVLHYGLVPRVDPATWRFRADGAVRQVAEWSFAQFLALGETQSTSDVHCVTGWSRFDNVWRGVPYGALEARLELLPTARFALVRAVGGWTANLPVDDLRAPGVLFATHHDGVPLSREHGGPIRLVVPHLYFWKSAKWVTGITYLEHDEPGFWEVNGYHMRGDPWKEERFRDD